MTDQESFISVQLSLFNRMREHCEKCSDFNIALQFLSNGRVISAKALSKKRKAPAESKGQDVTESSRQTRQPDAETIELLPSQTCGTRLSTQPDAESVQAVVSLLETPATSDPRSKSGKGKQPKRSRRITASDRFVHNAPTGNTWRKRQSELGLNTVEQYEHVISGFSRRAIAISRTSFSGETAETTSELVVVGKKLAVLTKSSLDNQVLQRSFAYFQVLILLSYCEFLRQKAVPYPLIDGILQTITNSRERDRKALLDTIPWIHKLIVELVRKGWTIHRATELFFLDPLSISDLIWIRSDETFKSILAYFSADTFVSFSYDDCITPSYTIPGLIAPLLIAVGSSNQISLVEIYDSLGYQSLDLPLSATEIYKVGPAKVTTNFGDFAEFQNLTNDSFVPAICENQSGNFSTKHSICSLIRAIGSIPKFVLQLAVSPQKRWNEYGGQYQIEPRNTQLCRHLQDLFQDSEKLWQVLEHLTSLATIGIERTENMETYICGLEFPGYQHGQEKYWLEQTLWLFCYVFPRNPTFLSAPRKEKLLQILEHLLQRYGETNLKIPSDDEVVETFLAAAKFGPLSRRRLILSLVDPLLQNTRTVHLQAKAIYQRSVILRLNGDIDSSDRLLQGFLGCLDTTSRLKSTSILGLLYLSQAANYIYRLNYALADKEAKKWMPPALNITEEQLDVLWDQIYSAGRISKGQANFLAARQFFERCLETRPLCESKRFLALSHLADTYVEVDYQQRLETNSFHAGEMLVKAETLIAAEVQRSRSHISHSKAFRRLLLSLSEIKIRQGQFHEAQRLLTELCSTFSNLSNPDIIDRHSHLRAFISLARIAPVSDAESSWSTALELGRRYYPFEEEVFVVAIMHLFICTARLQRGDVHGAKAAFDYAAEICRAKPPQFVMPGLGTYLYDDVRNQIESRAGWNLPKISICT